MNWVNSGSSVSPPSSTSLSKSAHCLHGRHRNVTNNGRFFCRASANAPARLVRHVNVMLADAGNFPCAGPSISFQGGIAPGWVPFAPRPSATERRRAFMARSFPVREVKGNRVDEVKRNDSALSTSPPDSGQVYLQCPNLPPESVQVISLQPDLAKISGTRLPLCSSNL
jgi:hypothetical protein